MCHCRCSHDPIRETRYRVTGLVEGYEYEFRVSAENKAGVGQTSDESDTCVARDPLCKCITIGASGLT